MGVRVRAQAAMARGRDVGQRVAELSVRVEKCVRPVAPQPGFELHQAFGIREVGDRHLVRAPGALDRLAIAYHPGDNPIGVVEVRALRHRKPAAAPRHEHVLDCVRKRTDTGLILNDPLSPLEAVWPGAEMSHAHHECLHVRT